MYQPSTPEEYLRYLPVILCNVALGNNPTNAKYRIGNGSAATLFVYLADTVYHLERSWTTDASELQAWVQSGGVAITNVGKGNIFTGGEHFMFVPYIDDDYIYIMDPYLKPNDDYSATDKHGRIEVLQPGTGLLRLKRSDWKWLGFGGFYLFKKEAQTFVTQ